MEFMVKILVAIVLFVLVNLVSSLVVQFCWNHLMPAIFGLKTITFWQAFGLQVLTACFSSGKVSYKGDN